MKKTIFVLILVLIIILLGTSGFIYYNYFYPYSGNAPQITQEELECGAYFGQYNQKKPGTPDNWVWTEAGRQSTWYDPENSQSPLECPKSDLIVGGCAGVSLEYRQECCDNWAQENGMVHAQCVGEWTIKDNKCAWECQTF